MTLNSTVQGPRKNEANVILIEIKNYKSEPDYPEPVNLRNNELYLFIIV